MSTYRIWPSTSGGAGAADVTESLGTEFYVTSACNFNGFWFWCPSGGNTTAVTCQLYSVTTATTGAAVSGTLVTSGTLTANAWNWVPLVTPVALTVNQHYRATVYKSTGGTITWYGASSGIFGSEIINGPLRCCSTATAVGGIQGSYNPAGVISFPSSEFNNLCYWVDVEVADPGGADVDGDATRPVTATVAASGSVSHLSPPLAISGFGSFPDISPSDEITSVTARVGQYASDAGMGAPAYELWDGAAARIGAAQAGSASTTPGHYDEVTWTGVTYSQLASLRLRVVANSGAAPAAAVVYVDYAALSVIYVRAGGPAAGNSATALSLAVTAGGAAIHPGGASLAVSAAVAAAGAVVTPGGVTVSFTFDDGTSDQQTAATLLASHGWAGTFYIITNDIGGGGFFTAVQLRALQTAGHDVGGHTMGHGYLDAMSNTTATSEISGCRTALTGAGITNPVSFAYPFGAQTAATGQICDTAGWDTARSYGGGTDTLPPVDGNYAVRSYDMCEIGGTLAIYQAVITAAEALPGDKWVVFAIHKVGASYSETGSTISSTVFGSFLDWLDGRDGIEVKSMAQAATPAHRTAAVTSYRWETDQDTASFTLVSDSAAYTFGVEFEVTSACRLTGYHWPRDLAAADLPSSFALYRVTGAGAGTLVPGSEASFGTMVRGVSGQVQAVWNRVPVDGQVLLTPGNRYKACVYMPGGGNWLSTIAGYWTTGGGSAGITRGPLHFFGASTSTDGQNTAHSGTGLAYPATSLAGACRPVDVEVSTGVPATGAAGAPLTVTVTAAGTVTSGGTTWTGAASAAVSAAVSCAGAVTRPGAASAPLTAAVAATGARSYAGAASAPLAAAVAAAGTPGRPGAAAVSLAAAVAATGAVTTLGGATRAVTVGVAADATTGAAPKTGDAAPVVAGTVTAAGVPARPGDAAVPLAAVVAAAGVPVRPGASAPALAAGVVAAGALALPGAATPAVSAGVAATGAVTRLGGAAAPVSAGVAATGAAALLGASGPSVSAGVAAAGSGIFRGAAALSAAVGVSSDGLTGIAPKTGDVQASLTAAVSAAGYAAHPGGASAALSVAVSADGTVTRPAAQAVALAATVASAAALVLRPAADVSLAAAVVAAGVVGAAPKTGDVAVALAGAAVAAGIRQTPGEGQPSAQVAVVAAGDAAAAGGTAVAPSLAVSASGSVTRPGAAAVAGIVGVLADGLSGATGQAPVPVTATVAAAGLVTRVQGATVPLAASVTADGNTARTGDAAVSATAAITADGLATHPGAAAAALTAAVTAAGVAGGPTSVTVTATAAVTASAQVIHSGDVALALTAGVNAAPGLICAGAVAISLTAAVQAVALAGTGSQPRTVTATVVTAGLVLRPATAALSWAGAVAAAGTGIYPALAAVVAAAAIRADATVAHAIFYGASITAGGPLVAARAAGDALTRAATAGAAAAGATTEGKP